MILAAGLTPAWQRILEFERFVPGEVNRAQHAAWCASGKVLNVGLALTRLGAPSRVVSLKGGVTGRQIEEEFAQLGVRARWIEDLQPTRVCTTILDRATGSTTELVQNAEAARREVLEEFARTFRDAARDADVVILSGSLPPGTPSHYYRELLDGFAGRALLDVRGPELLEALAARPLLVKPNREELARTIGKSLGDEKSLRAAMRQLNNLGAEWVLVTDGANPVRLGSAGQTLRLVPPSTTPVNPIGCGDCLAAGLAVAIAEGRSVPEAARFGVAAALDNLTQLLPARLDRTRIDGLASQITVEEC